MVKTKGARDKCAVPKNEFISDPYFLVPRSLVACLNESVEMFLFFEIFGVSIFIFFVSRLNSVAIRLGVNQLICGINNGYLMYFLKG